MAQLRQDLERKDRIDITERVHIQVTNESMHGKLVDLLDLCADLKLTNLSIISSAGY